MDDLDRMFRRLMQNIHNGYPDYLDRPFEVAELYQHLMPYRHNRRELGIETNQDYEVALCHLLAGERGYLVGDEVMQDAIGRELASSNPNTAIFREYAASRVTLSPHAEARYRAMDPDTAPSPSAAASGASAPAAPASSPPSPPPSAPAGAPAGRAGYAHPPASARTSEPEPEPALFATSSAREAIARAASSKETPPECRYCGGKLPGGRRTMFCPYCGQNLTIQRCPACGTELEIGWKYCITCGRGVAADATHD